MTEQRRACRMVHVSDTGDDLSGDGSVIRPFLTRARAETDAQVGDVIVFSYSVRYRVNWSLLGCWAFVFGLGAAFAWVILR